ncbi:MAG: diaminopimelate epimerase [Flavipsychrobacter sp.]
MNIHFYKYQGTGNDFVLIDNRAGDIALSKEQVAFLCDRRFGIGADGLMLLENADGYDFKMVYYNADGNESTMCGNGGRCIAAFAKRLGVITHTATFIAIDGPHTANIDEKGTVSLSMQDVASVERHDDHTVIDTGSPHYVTTVNSVEAIDVKATGSAIRNNERFKTEGINVNFSEKVADGIKVRTYERGVEDETYSCGTGVTAAAIAHTEQQLGQFSINIATPGGALMVSLEKDSPDSAINITLNGPATFVYEGDIAF